MEKVNAMITLLKGKNYRKEAVESDLLSDVNDILRFTYRAVNGSLNCYQIIEYKYDKEQNIGYFDLLVEKQRYNLKVYLGLEHPNETFLEIVSIYHKQTEKEWTLSVLEKLGDWLIQTEAKIYLEMEEEKVLKIVTEYLRDKGYKSDDVQVYNITQYEDNEHSDVFRRVELSFSKKFYMEILYTRKGNVYYPVAFNIKEE